MNRLLLVLLLLVGLNSVAQPLASGRVSLVGNGSTMEFTPSNLQRGGPQTAFGVANSCNLQPAPGVPCLASSLSNKPFLAVGTFGGTGLFDTVLKHWSYPQNVNIGTLRFRICYTLTGTVMGAFEIRPVYRHKGTNQTFEGPPIVIVPSSLPLASMLYVDATSSWATGRTSPYVDWNLANTGAPTISSLDVFNDQIEIGVRVVASPNQPWQPVVQDAMQIRGIQVIAILDRTPLAQHPAPVATYTPGSPWSTGTVTLTQKIPDPSSGGGLYFYVRCANGTYSNGGPSSLWGNPANRTYSAANGWTYSSTFSLATLNGWCPNSPLSPGQTTYIQSEQTGPNGPTQAIMTSGAIILN